MAERRRFYKVTFVRHGGQEQLTFCCPTDAGTFVWWLDYAGVGIDAEIIEEMG